MVVLDEIDRQNIKEVVSWIFVEDYMPIIANYITNKCITENLNLQDFLTQETDQPTDRIIRVVNKEKASYGNKAFSIEDFIEGTHGISPHSLQEYLDKLAYSLAKDLQVQLILKDLDGRTQQIKDAALPDTQKLSLIQILMLFLKMYGKLLRIPD